MRQTTVVGHLTAEELKQRMRESQEGRQFQRWQVIYMMSTKRFRAKETAELVSVSKGTVHQWVHLYNHQGPEALGLQGRGGRRKALLSWKEEEALLAELRDKGKQGTVIIARTVRECAEKRMRRNVSKDYAYDLLHRHGWRKIAPRPRHPKRDKARQEEFKKNSRTLWLPPAKASPKTIGDR